MLLSSQHMPSYVSVLLEPRIPIPLGDLDHYPLPQ
jgi:hypothetical protein